MAPHLLAPSRLLWADAAASPPDCAGGGDACSAAPLDGSAQPAQADGFRPADFGPLLLLYRQLTAAHPAADEAAAPADGSQAAGAPQLLDPGVLSAYSARRAVSLPVPGATSALGAAASCTQGSAGARSAAPSHAPTSHAPPPPTSEDDLAPSEPDWDAMLAGERTHHSCLPQPTSTPPGACPDTAGAVPGFPVAVSVDPSQRAGAWRLPCAGAAAQWPCAASVAAGAAPYSLVPLLQPCALSAQPQALDLLLGAGFGGCQADCLARC
jgi:hypothetical protein